MRRFYTIGFGLGPTFFLELYRTRQERKDIFCEKPKKENVMSFERIDRKAGLFNNQDISWLLI